VRVANFNIRATPPMRAQRVRSDLRVAKALLASVVFWQELGKIPWYRRILRTIFPTAEGWRHFHLDRRTAISVDTDRCTVRWELSHKLTGGDARLPQPSRYTNEVVVEYGPLDQKEAALLSSHFDNGGYNGRWRPDWNRKIRRRRWDVQFAETREIVREHHEAGRWVYGGMDINRRRPPKFHPKQEWLAVDEVSALYCVPPPGVELKVSDVVVIPEHGLFTDHAGLAATARKKKPDRV
jgi:hypothetical protein